MMRAARALFVAIIVTIVSPPLAAQTTPTSGSIQGTSGVSRLDDSVRALASMLRCPVCQGESIQESPAALAGEMRQVVREQLAAGRTPEEVKAYFVSKYGEWILLQPKAKGVNLTVYLLPLLMLLGGALVIVFALRRWTQPRTEFKSDSPAE
jgi:cytochrome c-type biogenesis protein CcmH